MSKFKDLTVLVTAAGNVFMPGTAFALKNNGERNIRLIGADMNKDDTILQMFDKYYTVPRGDSPQYVDIIYDICKKEDVDIVLPIMSVELNALSRAKEKFKKAGIVISVTDINSLETANDKLKLFDYMKSNNITCADYMSVSSFKELEKAVNVLGYPNKPVCIKATNGSGSRGFRILDSNKSKFDLFFNEKPTSCFSTLDDIKEILSSKANFPTIMVMEYLPGTEYTVDLLADKGKVLYNCCRKSLNMENSIMLDGIVENNTDVLDICKQVTEKLKLDGNIGFDVKERADGTAVIMECNPRITAGISLFTAAGVNLLYLRIKQLLGEELPKAEPKTGVKMKRRWKEMFSE